MSIIVMPQTIVTLSAFLKTNDLTLLVRETGSSKWEASFEPDVFEDAGEKNDDDAEIFTDVRIEGESTQEAIKLMCEFLSGNDDLCIDDGMGCQVALDLYYTRVECDQEGVENAVEKKPNPSSFMKHTMRHHGSE
jgi:hypothetical protein